LEKDAVITFESSDEARSEHLEALFELHHARWALKQDAGMIPPGSTECFHRKAACNLSLDKIVRFHVLRRNGAIVALTYVLYHRQRAYSYLGGFDPDMSRFSPGTLILGYAIEQAIQDGMTHFDFLRGDEEYKTDWGAQPYTTYRLLLWPERT
jgi:CelD/BcsL family acetyltransferase involved in cellulose biosynthesis